MVSERSVVGFDSSLVGIYFITFLVCVPKWFPRGVSKTFRFLSCTFCKIASLCIILKHERNPTGYETLNISSCEN